MKARRDKPKKIQPEYHLIITEGTDTEPAYFGAMRDIINSTYSDHINKTAELCVSKSTEETTYHAIWSNQCIELWFLLHFSFMQSDLHRTSYWPKLTEILTSLGVGEYVKNRTDMYRILIPYMDAAIANAEKLDKINKGKLPSASAPGTKVYELVKKLKPYLS